MPSGSKKRKASKKPKPGESSSSQSELEPGSEEPLTKDGEEMADGSLSPKAMDGASEAMAEVGEEEGKEFLGEASRKEDEVAKVEEAPIPDHPEVYPMKLEVPTIFEVEARDENEVEGETPFEISQGESSPQIEQEKDIPLGETAQDSEALPGEIKTEVEPYAELTEVGREKNGEGAPIELDESHGELERLAALSEEDSVPPENDTTPGDTPAEEVYIQPEKDEAIVAREIDTQAGSANKEPEGIDVTPIEIATEFGDIPPSVQSEVEKAAVETEPEADAAAEILDINSEIGVAQADDQSEMDQYPVAVEAEASSTPSANIEPEAEEHTSPEIIAETDKGLFDAQSEMEEATDQQQIETDAFSREIEPETAQNGLDEEANLIEQDTSTDEVHQEVEPVAPKIESQTNVLEGEIECSTDVASVDFEPELDMDSRAAEFESEASLGNLNPEVDVTLDDIENVGVAEADINSEVNAASVETGQNQVVTEAELNEKASLEVEPVVEVQNAYTSQEAEADALREVKFEPERSGDASGELKAVIWPTTQQVEEEVEPSIEALSEAEVHGTKGDLDGGVEASLEAHTEPKDATIEEVELVDDTEPAIDPLNEASEVSGLEEEFTHGKTDKKLDGVTISTYEPEAQPEVPDPEGEALSISKPDQEGSNESESGQQDLIEVEPDQPNVQVHHQQQEREPDLGVEVPELPASEVNQEESLAVSATSEIDGSTLSAPEGEVPAIADTDVPVNEPETLEEGEVVSPSGEANTAETEVELDSKEGAVDNEAKNGIQQETADVDDASDQEKLPSGEFCRSAAPSAQDSEIEQLPPITVDEEIALGEGPSPAKTGHIESIFDKQSLTMDPSIINMPSGESEIVEQSLSTPPLPPESEVTVNEDGSKDGATFEQEQSFDLPSGDTERDIGEEETASSTVAEAGSVVNDFDDTASYQLPGDFPSFEQDAEISEGRESDHTPSSTTPELILAGLTEQTDAEGKELDDSSSPSALEFVGVESTKRGSGEHADSNGEDSKVSSVAVGICPEVEVEWKSVQDVEPTTDHEEVSSESTTAQTAETTMLESFIEVPVDVCLSEGSNAPDKEVITVEAGGGGDDKDGQGTAAPALGFVSATGLLAGAEELMPKVLPSHTDGLRSLPSSEATMRDLFTAGEGTGTQDNAVLDSTEPEIYNSEVNDSKEVADLPSGEVLINTLNATSPQSTSPRQDREVVQAFRQQKTQETSLPMVVPAQDVKQKALEQRNLKGDELPSRGGTLQRRNNLLGCCGLFDLLAGKNK